MERVKLIFSKQNLNFIDAISNWQGVKLLIYKMLVHEIHLGLRKFQILIPFFSEIQVAIA